MEKNSTRLVYSEGAAGDPGFNTPVASIAAPAGQRSISRFFQSAFDRIRQFVNSAPTESGCAICTSGHSNVRRLAALVAILPVGQKVTVPAISRILGVSFKTISSDLHVLVHQLRLPIKRTHQGFLLTDPVHLCENCTRLGKQFLQTNARRLDQLRNQQNQPD